MTLAFLRTSSSEGWVTGGQMLCIHTHARVGLLPYVTKYTKHEPEESEVDLMTRGCLEVDYKDERKRPVEGPRATRTR